jgi:uncharacterized phage protein gp47/JayE
MGVCAIPYSRPTLTALRDQAVQDIATSGVPHLDGLLRNAVLRVLAWVMSGLAYSVYGYLDWIAREAVPFTATDEYLEAWAALIGVYRKDATAATGQAQFTLGVPGTFLAAGAALTRQDATPYTSTADATADVAGTLTVPIVAAVLGAYTDCDAGTPIGLATPLAGVNNDGTILAPGCTGGADQESDTEFRTRMLLKYAQPPQGGAVADYLEWALEVPGCTRAWVGTEMGPGTVTVRVMFDDTEAAHGGFPQGTDGCATEETRAAVATGDQLTVANHIWPVQPVTALVYVKAPTALPVNVTLLALDPNTPDIQAEIIAAITDMLLVKAVPGGTIYPSDLYEAILATPGLNHFTMSVPSAPIVAAVGALPVMGTLTVT